MPFIATLSWSTLNMLGEPSVLSLLCSRLLLCVCWVAVHSSPPPSQWRPTERYTQSITSFFQGSSQLSSSFVEVGLACETSLFIQHATKAGEEQILQIVCLCWDLVSFLGF